MSEERPFFGKEIFVNDEKKVVQKILRKYRSSPVSEQLKNKIYDELEKAKAKGLLSVPFNVIMRKDPSKVHRDFIEILLETKV